MAKSAMKGAMKGHATFLMKGDANKSYVIKLIDKNLFYHLIFIVLTTNIINPYT